MSWYETVAKGPERRFEITGGLQEGYEAYGAVHTLGDVVAAHHEWQRTLHMIIGVTVSACTISYGWPVKDETKCASEPGFNLSGVMNVQYADKVPDNVASEYLNSLAQLVAERLNQTRVYLSFMGTAYILEREGAVLPTSK